MTSTRYIGRRVTMKAAESHTARQASLEVAREVTGFEPECVPAEPTLSSVSPPCDRGVVCNTDQAIVGYSCKQETAETSHNGSPGECPAGCSTSETNVSTSDDLSVERGQVRNRESQTCPVSSRHAHARVNWFIGLICIL